MSTRGVIARKTEHGIQGRYHHWDSYPSALGATLYRLYHGHFQHDINAMLHYLIDEHPAGWSSINNCDFTLQPGFVNYEDEIKDDDKRPQCYCHGTRHEKEMLFTSTSDIEQSWCLYAYIIDAVSASMTIRAKESGKWNEIAVIDFNANEPDWDSVERMLW